MLFRLPATATHPRRPAAETRDRPPCTLSEFILYPISYLPLRSRTCPQDNSRFRVTPTREGLTDGRQDPDDTRCAGNAASQSGHPTDRNALPDRGPTRSSRAPAGSPTSGEPLPADSRMTTGHLCSERRPERCHRSPLPPLAGVLSSHPLQRRDHALDRLPHHRRETHASSEP